MILYILLLYILILLYSLAFFLVRKFNVSPFQIAFASQNNKSFKFFLPGKVRISRYLTLYECPECGYKSKEKSKICPHCKVEGGKTPLVAKTFPVQRRFSD